MIAPQLLAEWPLRSSLLIGVGALLLWALRIKDPSIRLAAWTAVLASSLAIPGLSATLPSVTLPVGWSIPAALPAVAARAGDNTPIVVQASAAALRIVNENITDATSQGPDPTGPRLSLTDRRSWALGAMAIYVLGACALFVRLLMGLGLSARLLRSSSRTHMTTEGIETRESNRISAPVTLGFLRPVIVLPTDWREWDRTTLEAVLAHERSHVRRRDPAVQLLSLIHRAVLWHNPLTWFLHRQIVRTAEDASDDAALAVTGDRTAYAEILLAFMQRGVGRWGAVGVPMARLGNPARRIDRVLAGTQVSRGIRRWTAAAIVTIAIPLACIAAAAQTRPAFDVADVHASPSRPDGRGVLQMEGGAVRGGRYEIHNATMLDLIATAYGVEADAVFGGPSWLALDRFEVIAKPPDGVTSASIDQMLQPLLADRFGLVVRQDSRPLPAWVLSKGAGEPRLRRSSGSDDSGCGLLFERDRLSCRNVTIDAFADWLRAQHRPTRPLINETSIEGAWDFDVDGVDLARERSISESSPMVDAIEQQLGLRLALQPVPQPGIVVESVNRSPTPNVPDIETRLPPDPVEFEVASIRPCQFVSPTTTGGNTGLRMSPSGQVTTGCQPLSMHIATAWSLGADMRAMGGVVLRVANATKIEGAPSWMNANKAFDIIAKAPIALTRPLVTDAKYRAMLRNLLEERFKIVTHYEDRPVEVYRLVTVAPKLTKADASSRAECRSTGVIIGAPTTVTCQNVTMAQFVEELNHAMPIATAGRRIVDDTGIQGTWDVTLRYRYGPVPLAAPGVASEPTGDVSIPEALERQLGLKLVDAKRPMPVFVIDHIEENPTEN
jgi:uncharacterized protein (TIGR03435 family)